MKWFGRIGAAGAFGVSDQKTWYAARNELARTMGVEPGAVHVTLLEEAALIHERARQLLFSGVGCTSSVENMYFDAVQDEIIRDVTLNFDSMLTCAPKTKTKKRAQRRKSKNTR